MSVTELLRHCFRHMLTRPDRRHENAYDFSYCILCSLLVYNLH